jgi:hypothetical protein
MVPRSFKKKLKSRKFQNGRKFGLKSEANANPTQK